MSSKLIKLAVLFVGVGFMGTTFAANSGSGGTWYRFSCPSWEQLSLPTGSNYMLRGNLQTNSSMEIGIAQVTALPEGGTWAKQWQSIRYEPNIGGVPFLSCFYSGSSSGGLNTVNGSASADDVQKALSYCSTSVNGPRITSILSSRSISTIHCLVKD